MLVDLDLLLAYLQAQITLEQTSIPFWTKLRAAFRDNFDNKKLEDTINAQTF